MDSFGLFLWRDMILETTILAEKQPQNVTQYAEEEKSDDNINAQNIDAQIIDKMLEDKISTRMRNKLWNANIFNRCI